MCRGGGGLPKTSLGAEGAGLPFNPRLRESLSTIQADNLALGEKLRDLVRPQPRTHLLCGAFSPPPSPAPGQAPGRRHLPTSGPCNPLFQPDSLYKSLKEEARAILEGEKAIQEEGEAFQEEGKTIQEGAQAIQEGALFQVPGTPPSSGWGERTSLPSATQPIPPCLQQPSSQMAGLVILQPDPALNSGNTSALGPS